MKTTISCVFILIISISSCITTSNTYSDPNYLHANEFQTIIPTISQENIINNQEYTNEDTVSSQSENIVNNYYGDYYEDGSQYDFYYSSRIRRFHRPYYGYGYYGNYYTNSYWYTRNPHHWGNSIYFTYGWGTPYHNNWMYYDPFYYSYYSYYTPYYYAGYYNHHHHGDYHGSSHSHNSNYNNYIFGPRKSLLRKTSHHSIKTSNGNNIKLNNPSKHIIKNNLKDHIKNTTNKSNTIKNIKNDDKGNIIKKDHASNKTKTNINQEKSRTKDVRNNTDTPNKNIPTRNKTIKSKNTTNKINKSYNNSKRNSYSPNKSYNKGNRSSGNNKGGRSIKPRK